MYFFQLLIAQNWKYISRENDWASKTNLSDLFSPATHFLTVLSKLSETAFISLSQKLEGKKKRKYNKEKREDLYHRFTRVLPFFFSPTKNYREEFLQNASTSRVEYSRVVRSIAYQKWPEVTDATLEAKREAAAAAAPKVSSRKNNWSNDRRKDNCQARRADKIS